MPFYSETLGLTDSAFTLLRDLIETHTGVFYDNGKRGLLADKLSPLVVAQGFDSFLDYYYLLKYDTAAGREWERVLDALSVPETYFWREIDQVETVVDLLLPRLAAGRSGQPLRIWSAACASGEEPLTLAIALNEAGWFERANIEIYASDASARALQKARQGVYRGRSFRALPAPLQTKYFQEQGPGVWQVDPALHRKINWSQANLTREADVAYLANAHIIFCRNVFIYFSEPAIRRTVSLFQKYMPRPGYLCVAAAESLLRVTTDFELQEIGGAFIYVNQQTNNRRIIWSG